MFKDKDVDSCNSEFLKKYNECCEIFIPKIDISGNLKTKPKWLTRGIKSNMRKRQFFGMRIKGQIEET